MSQFVMPSSSRSFRCTIPDCGYSWVGPAFEKEGVIRRHELRRHDTILEAEALLSGNLLPSPKRDIVQTDCICPPQLLDPDCPQHGLEAVW